MTTATVERQELHQVIDALPNEGVSAILNLIRSLQPNDWIDPIEAGTPNAETLYAIREIEEGGGVKFETAEELFKDLGI